MFFPTATGRKKRVKGASALKELEAKRAAKRARIDTDSKKVKVVEKKESEVDNKDNETAMETESVEGIFLTQYLYHFYKY